MKTDKKKYTPKYFKDNMPEWKRKKDPITSRIFYRPISFVVSSIAANIGLSANTVSYLSILLALSACVCLIISNNIINIIGAILVNLWLISDCTDGNIARSVKKQAFGEFADSVSSYILVAFLCTSIGMNAYFNGGCIIESKNIWIMLAGVLASTGDTLMRLIYQKYKSCEREMNDKGLLKIEEDKRTNKSEVNSLRVRIESDFGVGGVLPIIVLFGVLFNFMDLVTIYCFLYYFLSFVLMTTIYIKKAIVRSKGIFF